MCSGVGVPSHGAPPGREAREHDLPRALLSYFLPVSLHSNFRNKQQLLEIVDVLL